MQTRLPSSPRFVSPPHSAPFAQSNFTHAPLSLSFAHQHQHHQHQHQQSLPLAPKPTSMSIPTAPAHHLLTPSGRAFSVGGKVQNVSGDPLSPCVMYWPDNEPLPEQGQIRPSLIMGVAVRIFPLISLVFRWLFVGSRDGADTFLLLIYSSRRY